ncbi:MAG TPA: hypothetical protein VE989_10555 [Sphingomicrobium sp.]|nr:hypothetical protein [Sphingomicrobium sp.]
MRSLAALALLLNGCATVPLPSSEALLSEDQTVDLMVNPDRWIGRTVTIRIYPYDNGHTESYVACLEVCDTARADKSSFLVYTRANRFRGYRGDRAEIVKAVFGKICPERMPLCLDAPIRIFSLTEAS